MRKPNACLNCFLDPNTESIDVPGDILIGGLINVHRSDVSTENKCGRIDTQPGYQYLLAMLFALEGVNNSTDILPGIQLGLKIYDTCRSQTIGADRAKELIKYTLQERTNTTPPLAGVIGAFRSDVSLAVANLLRVFNIPQISYGSTTTDLSDKDVHSYFMRTVPPNSFQAKALLDVVKKYSWSYVMTVHSAGNYGERGMEKFLEEAKKEKICIAAKERVPSAPTKEDYKRIMEKLVDASRGRPANVVVLFCRQRDNRNLLAAANEMNEARTRFTYVANNAWGDRADVTDGHPVAGDGAITVNHFEAKVERFEWHFRNLTSDSYKAPTYPWYEEFWQIVMNCKLPNVSKPRDVPNNCIKGARIPQSVGITSIRVIMNAVYAMVHGLHNMWKDVCGGVSGMCPELRLLKREILLKYLRNVSFADAALPDFQIRFNKQGEVDGNYTIVNFRNESGTFCSKNIGTWGGVLLPDDSIKGRLTIDETMLQFRGGARSPPLSLCSRSCKIHQVKEPEISNPQCCWVCKTCGWNEIVVNSTCVECGNGHLASANFSSCHKNPVIYPKWNDKPSVILAVFAFIGFVCALSTAVFFVKHKSHRVIKAAGRELSAVLLVGIFLCNITTAMYFIKPSSFVCGLRRFTSTVSQTMCIAPVLLRTIRIYRIFKRARSSATRPSFVSPKSQVTLVFTVIGVQCLITTVWMMSAIPKAEETYPTKYIVHLECILNTYSVAINLVFNFGLIVISTLFAFKTRNFPANFNEAKYIGFTMYLICAVWTVLLPTYLNAKDSFLKSYLTSSAVLLVGFIALFGLFSPKIWLVYFGNVVTPGEDGMNSCTLTETTQQRSPNIRYLPPLQTRPVPILTVQSSEEHHAR